ncbi:hypothetical protein VCRA2120O389_70036 [Vibrio crassostreae]|nr:hypothetical protein VCRA2117O378_300035 [Vibrio crassostreae]CAK2231635.1 hypothetical protein VCRA2117O380_80174 [Vibrio crassostreae]CAK2241107.1 hypothetical protein VCRA2113O356_70035 [Vibrio crassostreae]CAK2549455.1 hypothetical protein VCRA2113O360_70036 [Vibrio crassostreae]CAK2581140.1 hypothetical protein VCRA2113O350_90035 [Vibrio crassostreae]
MLSIIEITEFEKTTKSTIANIKIRMLFLELKMRLGLSSKSKGKEIKREKKPVLDSVIISITTDIETKNNWVTLKLTSSFL